MLFRKRTPESEFPPAEADDLRRAQPQPDRGPAPQQIRTMKRQLNSSDVRTDRLVRQLREEIEGVRSILDEFAEDQEELLVADVEAIAEDPRAAASLPGTLLVRTILAVDEERADAVARVEARESEIAALEREIQSLRLSEAGLQGRLQTFEDVIAALHNNLEDLRYAREYSSQLAEPARPRLKAIHDDSSEGEAAGGRA